MPPKPYPQVNPLETKNFASTWAYKGQLFINLDQAHLAFATDFANHVLRNFIDSYLQQVETPKIISTE